MYLLNSPKEHIKAKTKLCHFTYEEKNIFVKFKGNIQSCISNFLLSELKKIKCSRPDESVFLSDVNLMLFVILPYIV